MVAQLVKITLYGGAREIGGNKIFLGSGNEQIFMDFGKSYSRWTEYYESPYLLPKSTAELIQTGLLPYPTGELKNLYTVYGRGKESSIEDEKEPQVKACIFSHAHGDHLLYMATLNRRIIMHMGETVRAIQRAYQEHGRMATCEDYLAGFKDGENIFTFRSGRKLALDNFTIYPYAVDHSVPGAYGFIGEVENLRFVYTGDFRWHGPAKELTSRFLSKVEEHQPIDYLICEGTCLTEPKGRSREALKTEDEVKQGISKVLRQYKGLAVANISSIDTDRINTIFEVAQSPDVNRKVAITLKIAAILARLKEQGIKNFPRLSEIYVYDVERKKPDLWQQYFLDGVRDVGRHVGEIEYKYGSFFKGALTSQDIIENSGDYILITAFYSLTELRELFELNNYQPFEGGVYLMSTSEPFNEELEIEFGRLRRWIRLTGLSYEHRHCSGHAHPEDIERLVRWIKPRKGVIPIHTENPEAFRRMLPEGSKPMMLERDKQYWIK